MEWVDIRLGDACTKIGSGATPKGGGSVYLDAGPIAFIRSQNIYSEGFSNDGMVYLDEKLAQGLANVQVEDLDVLLNITGDSVARACQVAQEVLPARVNQHVAIIRTNQQILWPTYLRYFLVSPAMQAHMLGLAAVGATRNALTKGMIESFSIRCPKEVEDQKAIAEVLSSLDIKIDLNRRINQTLEAMAQAIFQSWFVDFYPVKAKIAAKASRRDPLRAAMSVISGKAAAELDALPPEQREQLAATAALFPDEMEESEVGEVPKGWSVGTLSNFASFQNGYAFKTKDWTDSGHPVVKIGNVKPGIIDLSGCSLVAHETVNGLDRFALKKGDLLVGMTGYVGETGLVPALYSVAYLNQRVGRISTVNGVSDIGYPFCLVRDPAYKAYAESKAHGSAQANVSGKDLMDYQAVVPDAGVLKIFNAQVAKIINALLSYHEENQSLAALRDTLLPRLLSGELLVADAMAEAVA